MIVEDGAYFAGGAFAALVTVYFGFCLSKLLKRSILHSRLRRLSRQSKRLNEIAWTARRSDPTLPTKRQGGKIQAQRYKLKLLHTRLPKDPQVQAKAWRAVGLGPEPTLGALRIADRLSSTFSIKETALPPSRVEIV